jgi:hypothetical protein
VEGWNNYSRFGDLVKVKKGEGVLVTWFVWQPHGVYWSLEIMWFSPVFSRMRQSCWTISNILLGFLVGMAVKIFGLVFRPFGLFQRHTIIFFFCKVLSAPFTPL